GQGRRHRLRAGRQGTGRLHGDAPAAARRPAEARRCRRRPRAGHLSHLARACGKPPAADRRRPPQHRSRTTSEGHPMIAFVSGPIAALAPDAAVVEVGGIGMAVQCTPATLATLRVGQPARLATSLVVREDSLTLYGFASEDERNLFELVQTASGVGPKLAQAMLATHAPRELRRALATADLTTLTRVPGIGKKGAEKLVLELRDRIGEIGPDVDLTAAGGGGGAAAAGPGWREQVREGLVGLGWSARDADEAVAIVARAYPERDPDVAEALKQAMRLLAK